jgi:DNA-binding transcriptional MocR family regulator
MPEQMPAYPIVGRSARAIASSVEAAVEAGTLAPGAELPSVRTLAARLDVSSGTVASAYRELRVRGVIASEQRRRVRVADGPPVLHPGAALLVPAGARDVSGGNPDPALLPGLDDALARVAGRPRLYGSPAILPELAELARADLEEGGVDARSLTVTNGAMDAIERVLAAHLRPGDAVALEDPVYPSLLHVVRALGLAVVPVETDDAGLLPGGLAAALAAGARAVVVTPRAQNPTGAALDAPRAAALRDALTPHPSVLVVEDDHAGAVAGAPYLTLAAGRERWAVARSVAKALGPDLRLALLAGDAVTISRVAGRHALGPGWVSWLAQRIVVELLRDPQTPSLLERAAGAYAERSAALVGALAGRGVAARGRSGLNVWIPVPHEAATVQALSSLGWVVAPGERFRLRSGPAIRVTTATLAPEEAPVLATAISDVLGGAPASRDT